MERGAPPRDDLGATHLGGGRTRFLVWAPHAERVEVVCEGRAPIEAGPGEHGYHEALATGCPPGTRYRYRLHRDGHPPVERSDPASRWQPDGLHGPSAVDDPDFDWSDAGWRAAPLYEQVVYELHVGTFTVEGTFDGVIDHLDGLRELGVTTLELLPVWQFPGERNWGYDGVLAFAVQHSYGGPPGLRRLVDAAHARGLGVWLDVVYNHLGPEGNHLGDFGPYLTEHTGTPWGQAVNFDGPGSDGVRRYVVENAARWIRDFHLDGLRLDAVHAILDTSAVHVLEAVGRAAHDEGARAGRPVHVIAESDLSDPRVVRPTALGGHGLDGQWLDDVHHAVHVSLTGEGRGHFVDFTGLAELARTLTDRYSLAGRYSVHRGRTIGRRAPDVPYHRFVVCTQNHDQIGNRAFGERQASLLDADQLRFAAGALLLLPFTPMLFMGQEYGEQSPFQYFVSHTDPELVAAVREGRRREHAGLHGGSLPPDPQDVATFERSRLDRSLASEPVNAELYLLHRELLALRRTVPALTDPDGPDCVPHLHGADTLSFERAAEPPSRPGVLVVLHAGPGPTSVCLPASTPWELLVDTADSAWGGGGGTRLLGAAPTQRLAVEGPTAALLVEADPQARSHP